MAGSSESSAPISSDTTQQEPEITESQAWYLDGAGRGADEGNWFGAFHVPRDEPGSDNSGLVPSGHQGYGSDAKGDTEEEAQDCISCGTRTRDVRRLTCGHLWGRTCLYTMIEFAMQWEGNFPARCCQKIDEVEMKELAPFLGEGIVQRYLDKAEEMEAPRDQRVYCANPRCSAFLGRRSSESRSHRCPKCDTSTCLACSVEEKPNDRHQCPPHIVTVSHKELIESGKLQQCPSCPEVIELREACNHITCLCGMEFCFSCGSIWRTCFCGLYPGAEHEPEETEQDERAAEADAAFASARATCVHPIMDNVRRRARCEYCGYSSRVRMHRCARCAIVVCWDCYDRLNMYVIGAAALRQEAALMRANMGRDDDLGD